MPSRSSFTTQVRVFQAPVAPVGLQSPTPRPALWPLRLRLWPALSAPPPFMTGFPAGCAVLAGGHKTLLTTRKATVLPASGGTHISLSDSHGHTPTSTRCCGAVPEAFPVSEDVLCAGPSARHLRPHRSPEGQVALLREKRTEGSCQRAGLPGRPEGPPCQRGRRSLPGPDAAV